MRPSVHAWRSRSRVRSAGSPQDISRVFHTLPQFQLRLNEALAGYCELALEAYSRRDIERLHAERSHLRQLFKDLKATCGDVR